MKKCLVIDDSSVIRKVAHVFLSALDYRVTEAADAEAGLGALAQTSPDVILLDWHLPNMPALQFLAKLKTASLHRKPYIFYCTTENDPEDLQRAFAAGADNFILKPFDRATFTAKLSEMRSAA